MNNEVLVPTNLCDFTETLSKDAKILFVYQCICQCDSWGVLQRNDRLMSDREGIPENDVKSALQELEKMGLIVLIHNRLLIVVQDFVVWNYLKFLKGNNKHSQFEKQLKVAIKEGQLYECWLELINKGSKATRTMLKEFNIGVQVDIDDEDEIDSKDTNTNRVVSTSSSTSTTTSESSRDSSVSSNDERGVFNEDNLPFN
jgi:hypothetical protein